MVYERFIYLKMEAFHLGDSINSQNCREVFQRESWTYILYSAKCSMILSDKISCERYDDSFYNQNAPSIYNKYHYNHMADDTFQEAGNTLESGMVR